MSSQQQITPYSADFLSLSSTNSDFDLTVILIGVGSGGSGGALAPPACKISGNLSKCLYILPEKFVTAITSPKKKKVITCLASRLVTYLGRK